MVQRLSHEICVFQSIQRLKPLTIPKNGAAIFTLFIEDVHERWLELVVNAGSYISCGMGLDVNFLCITSGLVW